MDIGDPHTWAEGVAALKGGIELIRSAAERSAALSNAFVETTLKQMLPTNSLGKLFSQLKLLKR